MTRRPLEISPEVVPPRHLYAWPLGMAAIAALWWLLMAAYSHMNYTCVAFRAMCEERERLERVPATTPASVLPAQRWGPMHALQMPAKPEAGWLTSAEGCPSHYKAMNGACWIGVEEPPPCPTSYLRDGKCWAPLARAQRPGVSDGAFR